MTKYGRPLALGAVALAVVMMIMPYGMALTFGLESGEQVVQTYSYFALDVFGFANLFALPAGVLSCIWGMLLVLSFRSDKPMGRHLVILGAVSLCLSVMALVFSSTVRAWGVVVSVLLLAGAGLCTAGRTAAIVEAKLDDGDIIRVRPVSKAKKEKKGKKAEQEEPAPAVELETGAEVS